MEAVDLSEMSVNSYLMTWNCAPQDFILQARSWKL